MFDDDDGEVFGWVVPWSGEVVPIDVPPVPLPVLPPPQDWPQLLPNPAPAFRVAVSGAQYVWHDVWNATSGLFRSIVGAEQKVAQVTFDDVTGLVEQGISVAQTAWSSFISTLEGAIYNTIDNVGHYAIDAALDARMTAVELFDDIQFAAGAILNTVALDISAIDTDIANIERLLNLQTGAILSNIEAWAIDTIYNPLLDDITTSIDNTDTIVADAVQGIEGRLTQLENIDIPGLLEKLGAALGAIALITEWVDTCGEPTCEFVGPGSALGSLLSNAELLELLALLAAFALGDPQAIAAAAVRLAETLGPGLESVVDGWLAPIEHATFG